MSDPLPEKSAHATRSGPRGFPGLHGRITDEQLSAACSLIATGRATLESAIQIQITTTHTSIYRSRDAGLAASEKVDAGEELTDLEHAAFRFYACISRALAEREAILTRQALGDIVHVGTNADGSQVIASPRHAPQALEILRLTCRHWRPPKTEVEVTAPEGIKVEAVYSAEVEALRARIS